MKKIFFLLIIAYLVPVVVGNRGWQYFQERMATEYLYKYWYVLLISILLVFSLFYLVATKAFSVISDPRYKRFFLFAAIAFLFFVFIGNSGYVKFINNYIGQGEKVTINGTITNKYKNVRRKKEDRRSIEITEAVTGKKYVFRVRSSAYLSLNEGDSFSREFVKGSLGILFRTEK